MKGTCLCKNVSIESETINEFEACHCGICRRWGGGPSLTVHCGSNVSITGSDSIKIFDSSDWAERAFCSNCGTHLYYHLKPSDEYMVPLGLFGMETGFKFKEQIFIDRKPDFYEFANETENLTELQVLEKFGA